MRKKRRMIVALAVAVAAVAAMTILISCNVMVGKPELRNNGEPYLSGCTSIALFGKMEINGVDKVVISSENTSLTITDKDLVNRIVDKTKVARWAYNTGCGCCEQRGLTIDLYCGDKIMRSMEWVEDDIVKVYDCDLTHWVFPVDALYGYPVGGYALLSEELESQLLELLVNAQ